MISLEEHLSIENMHNVILLFPHPFGEMKRIVYRSLRIVSQSVVKSNKLIITEEKVEHYFNNKLIKTVHVLELNEMARISYREASLQILEYDKLIAQFVKIEADDQNGLVLSIQWQLE